MSTVNKGLFDNVVQHRHHLMATENWASGLIAGPFRDAQLAIRGILRGSFIPGAFSAAALRGIQDELEELIEQTYGEALVLLDGTLRDVTLAENEAAGGILLDELPEDVRETIIFDRLRPDQIDKLIHAPFHGHRLEDRVRSAKIAAKLTVVQALETAAIAGIGVSAAGSALRRAVGGAVYPTAARMTRTEIQRVANVAMLAMFAQNSHLLGGIQYVSALDDSTCPRCVANNMDTYYFAPWRSPTVDEAPEIPAHPNCRCAWSPFSDQGEPMPRTYYEAWVAGQTEKVQKEILGLPRWGSWVAGKLVLRDVAHAVPYKRTLRPALLAHIGGMGRRRRNNIQTP